MGMLTPGADPVSKISIIPRTMSLGVTVSAPESDRFHYDKRSLFARIEVATAGRAAEELVVGDETTGAENDQPQAYAAAGLAPPEDEAAPVEAAAPLAT
jgi:cell division protease FtsH